MVYVLAFATDSDLLIRSAYWTGVIAIVITLLLLATVIFLRAAWINQQRKRRKIIRRWRGPLTQAMDGEPIEKLPSLPRQDRLYFLEYWNYLHDSSKPNEHSGLNEVAQRLSLDGVAMRLSDSGYLWRKLLGIQTLGNLRLKTATEKLRTYVQGEDNVVSLTAARALMLIDPDKAAPEIIPSIAKRDDWAETRIAELLIEAGPTRTDAALSKLLATLPPTKQARVIRIIGATKGRQGYSEVRALLLRYEQEKNNLELAPAIVAGLEILHAQEDRPIIKSYLAHPDWHVRLAAANALGRVASPEDEKALAILLRDDHWWVRYRAAQAMSKLSSVSFEELRRRTDAEENPAAQDILRHVLAERQIAAGST